MTEGPIAPMRVLPVEFPMMPPRRHGWVTALGVAAIVVACLSMLSSGILALAALGMMIRSQVSTTAMTAQSQAIAAAAQAKNSRGRRVSPTGDEILADEMPVDRRGIDLAVRNTIVGALERKQRLSSDQHHQLHRLLAKCGKDMFPFATQSVSTSIIDSNISDSGPLASLNGRSAVYYIVGNGRLEIHDDRAIFTPSTPGSPTIRVQDGFDDDDDGSVNASRSSNGGIIAVSPTLPSYHIRGAVSATTIIESILSGLLAIYLLVVGILVLRQQRGGRKLQIIFAILKVPLAIVAAIAWMCAISDSISSSSSGASGVAPQIFCFIFVIVGCAYPISLLLLLNARTIRDYYAGKLD